MPDRASSVVLLAEDQEHQNLVWHYLKNCKEYKKKMGCVRKVALPGNSQCASQYVREQFPKEVSACRPRQAKSLLIVVTDADNLSASDRETTLHQALAENNLLALNAAEPVIILIPKWQVESWVKCLHGHVIEEDDKDTDKPPVTPQEVRIAASTLFEWARPNAKIGATCLNSLLSALPRWLRIG